MQHTFTNKWVSAGDLARVLGRHPDTIVRWESRGLIPQARRQPLTGRRVWPKPEADKIVRMTSPSGRD